METPFGPEVQIVNVDELMGVADAIEEHNAAVLKAMESETISISGYFTVGEDFMTYKGTGF